MEIPAANNLRLTQENGGVRIPIEYNSNDKGSLFAGSIYSGAVIAAYRKAEKLFASLGLEGPLVAKQAHVRYLKQLISDGMAVAVDNQEPVQQANGNYALNVKVSVNNLEGVACAEMDAEFILLIARP